MRDTTAWAEEEFGHAELGDARRTRRLVGLAAEIARRPAGTVTKACASSASREGAFRLLENDDVHPDAVASPTQQRTVERCRAYPRVIVPVDGSSLTLRDETGKKDVGGVGSWRKGARGVQTMTALAVSPSGSTLGVCAQRMWIRSSRSQHGSNEGASSTSESRFWLELMLETHRAFSEDAPGVQPWFQMDRGADSWPVLKLAGALGALVTVRAVYNRPLDGGGRLWTTLERARLVAKKRIDVPARPPARRKKRIGGGKRVSYLTAPRKQRVATVAIRAATVPLECRTRQGRVFTVTVNAVLVREQGHRHDDRLEWMLLTTHPIRSRRDVLEIVRAYTLRWRVEDFHRVWKRGLCRVEDTQLRSRNAIFKWATILGAVATRAMRLTHLARQTPDVPASTELSSSELQAIVALRRPKDFDDDDIPELTLQQAVRWIADIGGYTGPWNGPPGATVIGRGLHDVLVTAGAFEYRDKKR
jgi:hypothetical protein